MLRIRFHAVPGIPPQAMYNGVSNPHGSSQQAVFLPPLP